MFFTKKVFFCLSSWILLLPYPNHHIILVNNNNKCPEWFSFQKERKKWKKICRILPPVKVLNYCTFIIDNRREKDRFTPFLLFIFYISYLILLSLVMKLWMLFESCHCVSMNFTLESFLLSTTRRRRKKKNSFVSFRFLFCLFHSSLKISTFKCWKDVYIQNWKNKNEMSK